MSPRLVLSLLCFSVLFLSVVQLTHAGPGLILDEARTRVRFEKEVTDVVLPVNNSSDDTLKVNVQIELVDPEGRAASAITQTQVIKPGAQLLKLSLPMSLSKLNDRERRNILWYRLRYRLAAEKLGSTEGIISLSQITPDLFELRVVTSDIAREGNRYHARVRATHPITRRPVADVRVDGEVTLEQDEKDLKLKASKTTDAEGYALLDFVLPPRFPQFPHNLQPAGGEINVVGKRGDVVVEAEGDVLVDQFTKTLITTDKPLYQPGQEMHVRALLFSPAKHALANQNILIRICDPDEITVYRTVVTSSRFGVVNTDWPIPENARLGTYRIWVAVDGTNEWSQVAQEVRISRYDLPNFTVTVQPDRAYYLPGQNARVKVRADYLFGQPVTHGHVRVVRETQREWNYAEQKWDDEANEYTGEIDAGGFFVADIDLAEDHAELSDSDYDRYDDLTYTAYFTDPTTNRTEQRRFDLRVTKEAIHVYIVENYDSALNPALPLQFYVSAFYADGNPARCTVTAKLAKSPTQESPSKTIAKLRTNRYGLAKVSGIRLPGEFEDESEVDVIVSAVDSKGRTGSNTDDLSLDNDQTVTVDTRKTLYRSGEPISALITSTVPDARVVIDLVSDAGLVRSQRLQLHNGRGSVVFPYKPEFKERLIIAGYPDFARSRSAVATRTILYPSNTDLDVDVRTSKKTYRPGEDLQVDLNVRTADGRAAESALAVVVSDKAVEERFRTDEESGRQSFYSAEAALRSFLGQDEQIAGVSLANLQKLDMSKSISPDLELLAEVLVNQSRSYFPNFFGGGDQYETEQETVFGDTTKQQLMPIREALVTRYAGTMEYPRNEATLDSFLRDAQLELKTLRDPWGNNYRPYFSIDKHADELIFVSAGADKRFDTHDDFIVDRLRWAYFWPLRERLTMAVNRSGVISEAFLPLSIGGAIRGVVVDPVGGVIADTTVTLSRLPDGPSHTASTDDHGKYQFNGLPPGRYEVRFNKTGFNVTVVTDVLVRTSYVTNVNVTLELGMIAETVSITAGSALLHTESSNQSVGASLPRRNLTLVTKSGSSQELSTPHLREYFPETLLWQPSVETDKNGRTQINFKLADNITTWKLLVIGSTEDGLVGATEKEITAFQPFFVEHDPPRVLTEGDEISLPVVLRNYLPRPQKVDVEIKPESWFSLLGPALKRTTINAGDATRETFAFRAVNSIADGKQRITATAGDANDAIEKPITVHPDGEEVSTTAGDLLGTSATLELNIPETMIANSQRAELKIYPKLMAHVIESIEGIMQRPHGCGEQTISSTYPSLLLLRYYKQSGTDSPLRARAQRYLESGYSRLLNYRGEDGGFSYWGRGEADIALTAYALRFLTDAADVISIDEDVINDAREWLLKQQRPDGSWQRYAGNRPDNSVLTAYVTRILAMTSASTENAGVLKRAFDYLGRQATETNDPYLLASYALALLNTKDTAQTKPIVDKLRSLAQSDADTNYWSPRIETPFHGWGSAGSVETTALAAQALMRSESDPKLVNRALMFLLDKKDRYGVWHSTQATINVLDAMLALSANTSVSQRDSAAEIVIDGRVVQTVPLPPGDRLLNPITVDVSQFVKPGKNRVEIIHRNAAGASVASVHASIRYYVPWSTAGAANRSGDLRLIAKFDKTDSKINDEIACHVEAQRLTSNGYGMMIAEIGLPPGADVARSSLETATKSSDWAIAQYDILPDRVVVYLWPRAGAVKFDFRFRPRFGIKAKTAPSVLYDYYNPESRTIVPPATFTVM